MAAGGCCFGGEDTGEDVGGVEMEMGKIVEIGMLIVYNIEGFILCEDRD